MVSNFKTEIIKIICGIKSKLQFKGDYKFSDPIVTVFKYSNRIFNFI